MTIATAEKSAIIVALCRKYPKLPNKQLARMLFEKNPTLFKSVEAARSSVRHRRGNNGANNRKGNANPDLVRPNQPAGYTWLFPPSSAPSYPAFEIDSPRNLLLSDLHIPFHDPRAIHAVVEYAVPLDPTCILLNGDVCDFFSISRFEKNPTVSNLKRELTLTRQFLGWLRQKFPKARIVFKPGNHDEWWEKYLIAKAPELFGLEALSLKHLLSEAIGTAVEGVDGIEFVHDQRRIRLGKLNVWHGHEIGKGSIAPPVNPARGLFMRTLDNGLMGHLHKASNHEETTSNGKLISTWSTGCLCGLHPYYARVNKWTQSAAFVRLSAGLFNVSPIRVLNGKIL